MYTRFNDEHHIISILHELWSIIQRKKVNTDSTFVVGTNYFSRDEGGLTAVVVVFREFDFFLT